MNVRLVASTEAEDLRARYGSSLAPDDADALAACADARVLAVHSLNRGARVALESAGATVADTSHGVLVAASHAMIDRAATRCSAADRPLLEEIAVAFARANAGPAVLRARERTIELNAEARVMGIVNVTPDSFYERVEGSGAAVARTRAMVDAGAALVDVGGQSYANGNVRVSPEEEAARVVPAVEAIVAARLDVTISIDTFTAAVAESALAAGAHLINDCSGLADDALPQVVARHDAALVVMHLKGTLMVREPDRYVYRDALAEIVDDLYEKTERALAEGVGRDRIAIDPGLEFGKEPQTDLEILDRFAELRALGYPIVFASSRKSFIGRIFDRPAIELLVPSLATAAIGISAGARLLRVHDVAETVQLARMMAAVAPARRAALAPALRMRAAAGGNSGGVREV